jgi:hypothetical protein
MLSACDEIKGGEPVKAAGFLAVPFTGIWLNIYTGSYY